MQPLYLTGSSIVSALGAGLERTFAALREGRSGLRPNDFEPFPREIHDDNEAFGLFGV